MTAYSVGWLIAWGIMLAVMLLRSVATSWSEGWQLALAGINGVTYLSGQTLLVLGLGTYLFRPASSLTLAPKLHPTPTYEAVASQPAAFPSGRQERFVLFGIGGTTFSLIFLQLLLFRLLTIFGDYVTAHSVIAIALLGIAVGGGIGFYTARQAPLQAIIAASSLLPCTILMAFGASVRLVETPLLASLLLMLPFVCGSTVITVALARARSHVVYGIDLLGAAVGAVLIGPAFSYFREESSLLLLAAFTCIVAACFILVSSVARSRWLLVPLSVGLVGCVTIGSLNLHYDWLNIARTQVLPIYPEAEVLFSTSSLAGRYDVIRRTPQNQSLSAFQNGRIIDTLRRRKADDYRIDPRLPHTLIPDPKILILGVSGDGVAKTATFLGSHVDGVEINPAIVKLQTTDLVPFNGNSYQGINAHVIDGRSFLNQTDQQYDMITLMNAHSSRGRVGGQEPSPEYLHTREAFASYLAHLTDRGIVIAEEPMDQPRREPPVWKLLVTMRQALLDAGWPQPERHFFIFQWKTRRNNYCQIVMKKTPLTAADVQRLHQWLYDVDHIIPIQQRLGRRMGPIQKLKTTVLYAPHELLDEPLDGSSGESFQTNYAQIVRGTLSPELLQARNLTVATDDRPFLFDVNPDRPGVTQAYQRMLVLVGLCVPFLVLMLRRSQILLQHTLPIVLIVGVTGLGYFLVEMVLLQRYAMFLGSPVVTFSTVLGTLLVGSGAGSLWSGRVGHTGAYAALGGLLVLLGLHLSWIPALFALGAGLPLSGKIVATVISVAPLAFCMGVPFPFALRLAKEHCRGGPDGLDGPDGPDATAALFFAVNAATSASCPARAVSVYAMGLSGGLCAQCVTVCCGWYRDAGAQTSPSVGTGNRTDRLCLHRSLCLSLAG